MTPRPPSFEQELLALARRLSHVSRAVSMVVDSILARLQRNVEGKSEGDMIDVELTRNDLEAMRSVYREASTVLGGQILRKEAHRRALEERLHQMEVSIAHEKKAQAELERRSRLAFIQWKSSQPKAKSD